MVGVISMAKKIRYIRGTGIEKMGLNIIRISYTNVGNVEPVELFFKMSIGLVCAPQVNLGSLKRIIWEVKIYLLGV